MKSHKYWSIGALITMLGTFYTGYKGSKEGHKYFAASSLLCMIMAIYTGHKMISGKSRKKTINEQISNFAQTYPTNLKASSNEALLFMRRYRFANCSCFSCCFKDAYPSSNVQ